MVAARLSEEQVAHGLSALEAWRRDGETITRTFMLATFAAAIAFVDRVAELAEAANHHPDICIHGYRRVTLTLTSHDAGGLTARDLRLAAQFDGLGASASV